MTIFGTGSASDACRYRSSGLPSSYLLTSNPATLRSIGALSAWVGILKSFESIHDAGYSFGISSPSSKFELASSKSTEPGMGYSSFEGKSCSAADMARKLVQIRRDLIVNSLQFMIGGGFFFFTLIDFKKILSYLFYIDRTYLF